MDDRAKYARYFIGWIDGLLDERAIARYFVGWMTVRNTHVISLDGVMDFNLSNIPKLQYSRATNVDWYYCMRQFI